MSFKTTIFLFVLLIVLGTVALFSGRGRNTVVQQPEDIAKAGAGDRVFEAEPGQVTMVMVVGPDGSRMGVQKVSDIWHLTEPISSIGSQDSIQSFITWLMGLRSQGHPTALGNVDTGLDKPQYRIEIALDDGRTIRLKIGNKTNLGDQMYASIDGGDVSLVDPAILKRLKDASDELRNKHLMAIKSSEVRQFRLTWGGRTIAGSKFHGKWVIRQPNGVIIDGDEPAITALLNSINNIQAAEFIKPDDDSLKFAHFDNPSMQIWLTALADPDEPFPTTQADNGGKGAATLPSFRRDQVWVTVGAPENLSKENYFAKTSDGIDCKIPATSLDGLRKTALDLRDRQILTLDPDQIRSISIQKQVYPATQPTTRGGPVATPMIVTNQKIDITRATAPASTAPSTQTATWQFADDPKAKVDDQEVQALLKLFHPLRAENYLEKHPTEPTARFYAVELKSTTGATERIDITEPANDGHPFAIYSGLIFEVPTELTDALNADFHDTSK
jgi:hypothetical protein